MSRKMLLTIILLIIANIFMTFAWYGHLKFKDMTWFSGLGLFAVILISWGIAFFRVYFSGASQQNWLRRQRRAL